MTRTDASHRLCSVLVALLVLAAPAVSALPAAPAAAAGVPAGFLGTWMGTPDATPLGPLAANVTWTYAQTGQGQWLLKDTFSSASPIPDSVQYFFVDLGTDAHANDLYLTYCGLLHNFFSAVAPVRVMFQLSTAQSTATSLVFCLLDWEDGTTDCRTRYVHTLLGPSTLRLQVYLSDPVVHLDVTLTRTGPPPAAPELLATAPKPHVCPPFSPSARDAKTSDGQSPPQPARTASPASGCPYKHHLAPSLRHNTSTAADTEHCFIFNPKLDLRVRWRVTPDAKHLVVSVSANTPASSYLALGFGMEFPAMNISDIVLGAAASSVGGAGGGGCVLPLYAKEYVGLPVPNDQLKLTNTSVSYIGGRTTVNFTRPLASGYVPLSLDPPPTPTQALPIMFAIGDVSFLGGGSASGKDACAALQPSYHGHNRGLRVVDFSNPPATFPVHLHC